MSVALTDSSVTSRSVTRGAQGDESPLEKFSLLPGKMYWAWFETTGCSLKNVGPSQETLSPLVSQPGYGPGYKFDFLPTNCSYSFDRKLQCFLLLFSYKCFLFNSFLLPLTSCFHFWCCAWPLVLRSLQLPHAFYTSMCLEIIAVLHYNNHDGVFHACALKSVWKSLYFIKVR